MDWSNLDGQMDIFDFLSVDETPKQIVHKLIKKPIRLIETFAGYGSQALALKKIGANFEHWKMVEFDKYAVDSYNAIHGTNFPVSDIRDIHAENLEIQHTVDLALRANYLMHKDQDYVVKDDQILIVDDFTGRIMPGRRYSDGLHQAIEAKEHVKVKQESKTLATITFQNFFNKFDKKCGMTGTALTEEQEFRDIYGMDVVCVPTNVPVVRKDLDDAVFKTKREKYQAVVEAVKEAHEKGQPVLVGPDQRQLAHINVHMQVLQQIQEQVQNGLAEAQREWQEQGQMAQSAEGRLAPKVEDPERLMQVLVATSEHIQEHLEIFAMQPNAKDEAKRVQQVLSGLGDVTQALNLAIATQRRVREAEEEKRQRELEELQRAADQAEIAKANHKAELDAQNQRHKIDLDHQVAMERLRLQGEEGRQRLAIAAEGERGKHRLAFESARNDAILKSQMARGEMARKDAQTRQSLAIEQASAEQEAKQRAAEAAANRLEGRQNLRRVTGREAPRPSDLTEGAAGGGIVPL